MKWRKEIVFTDKVVEYLNKLDRSNVKPISIKIGHTVDDKTVIYYNANEEIRRDI